MSQGTTREHNLLGLILVAAALKDSLFIFYILVLRGRLTSVVVECHRVMLSLVREQLHALFLLLLLLLLNCLVVPQHFLGRARGRLLLRHFALSPRRNLLRLHVYYRRRIVTS